MQTWPEPQSAAPAFLAAISLSGSHAPHRPCYGIGWGAMVAMLSVLMAAEGFSGIGPAGGGFMPGIGKC
jgi:hypothetical protein